jgi:thiol:disulfide interchange protein DsbA
MRIEQQFGRYSGKSCYLLATILLLPLYGCARESSPQNSAMSTAAIDIEKLERSGWKRNAHYVLIDPPEFVQGKRDGIEVVEVFWYGCPHCYAFEPQLVLWENNQTAGVHLVRVPAVFNRDSRIHARLYYTLQELNREDLHQAVFNTIHRQRNGLTAPTDEAALNLLLQFAKSNGIDEGAFRRAYESEVVADKLLHADSMMRLFKVENIPAIVINGRFRTDATRAGGQEQLVTITQDIVTSQLPR